VVIFAAGPISLRSAILAALDLEKIGVSLKVVNTPWLNYIDPCWLQECITGLQKIFVLDNHYRIGGLADAMAMALEKSSISPNNLIRIGVSTIPPSGTNNEVLESLAIDHKSIYNLISQECLNIGLITKE
jgi:transketolase